MEIVDPADVEALTEGDVETVVPIVTVLAKSYTRGRGFTDSEPNDDIAAVIVTASARLLANPRQLSAVETIGPFVHDLRAGFDGWTLAELFVLNRYRVRAR